MDHAPLRYRFTMVHQCGCEFRMNSVESPPLFLICPGCEEILVLHRNSFDDGANYLKRGKWSERHNNGF